TNHLPEVRQNDEGLWRRLVHIPLHNALPEPERNPEIKERLRNPSTEGVGILAWMVEGCRAWQDGGLSVPVLVSDATKEYREEMDLIGQCLEEEAEFVEGAFVRLGDMWIRFQAWMKENGQEGLTRPQLNERLKAAGCRQRRGTGGGRRWDGVRLKGWH